MSVAQKFCCVGGCVSCIGTWGGRNSSCPALIIRLDAIFVFFQPCADFFVVQWVACYVVGALVARLGRGRGAFRWVGAWRGQRWVPLHSNPPLEVGGDLPPCPRWDCCRFDALRGIGFGKSGGVSKVSMGAISLSLVFPGLPLADGLVRKVQLLGQLFLGAALFPAKLRYKGAEFLFVDLIHSSHLGKIVAPADRFGNRRTVESHIFRSFLRVSGKFIIGCGI